MTHTSIASSRVLSVLRSPARFFVSATLIGVGALIAANQTQPKQANGVRDTRSAQTPTGSAVVGGAVVNADGGHPIRRSTVRLTSVALGVARVVTADDKGNFQFENLPPGQFTLSASKVGYLDATYGQKKPGSGRAGRSLSITEGQRLEHLALPMPLGGVISGTVVDDVGEPAFLTVIRALRYAWRAGERTLTIVGSAAADDRGAYRIPALPAGDYIIMAAPVSELPLASLRLAADSFAAGRGGAGAFALPFLSGGPGLAVERAAGSPDEAAPATDYAPVYFPTTTIASDASRVTLDVGQERSGIDVQLQLVPMGRIAGTISGADQSVLAGTTVTLVDTQGLPGMNVKSARAGADGTFAFTGVAPGQYNLSARSAAAVTVQPGKVDGQTIMVFGRGTRPGGPGGLQGPGAGSTPLMWASADLVVAGREPTTVVLTLRTSLTVSGKLAFDGAGAPPTDLTQVRILLSSVDANDKNAAAMGWSDAAGHFTLSGVTPGNYQVSVTGVPNWHAGSVEVAGRDALDFLLDMTPARSVADAVITLTDRVSEISGTLQDSLGRPTSDYTLVVFADDERFWTAQSRRILATTPASDGKFSFVNLPAGNYRLIAVDDIAEGQWLDPVFLRQISGAAISLKLADGERKTQDIRVSK
jgi:hypothetical protein